MVPKLQLAAIELIEDTMNDVIELSECPGCKQMVDVFGQNGTSSDFFKKTTLMAKRVLLFRIQLRIV